jgi:hypothetical protein
VHGALVVAHDHEDEPEQDRHRDGAEDRGRAQPRDLGQPRIGREQHDQQREHVEQALDDDGPDRLGPRRRRAPVQGDDARRLAGARGQDVVEEVADQQRVRDRAQRRALVRREERPPAQRAQRDRQHEDRHRRRQPEQVAVAQRLDGVVQRDTADGEVHARDRDDEPRRGKQRPQTAALGHRRRSRTQNSTRIALKPSRQVMFLPSAYVRP